MYAKIQNNTPVEWPVRDFQIRSAMTVVSLPATLTAEVVMPYGFEPYAEATKPEINSLVEKVEERTPAKQGSVWTQQWEVVQLYSPAEREQILAEAAVQAAADAAAALQKSIVEATQQRLDDFAKERGYDGILSACTYASSAVPKFQTEGQYCANSRDDTWATLYAILGEVQAGTRAVPTGFGDIEADLPELLWPVYS